VWLSSGQLLQLLQQCSDPSVRQTLYTHGCRPKLLKATQLMDQLARSVSGGLLLQH
jgi:hypothetical protein